MLEKPLISFDYAIKYLLKNKGDYDIIEGFISALLATEGYKPVKITALLESESNKETADLKKSIADLVVQDVAGNQYIVEIERAFTPNFMHKACFNTCRLVVDSISGNQDYTTIKKVFHISLLYFSTQQMEKPIYHGQTIVHEIDTAHPVNVRIANQSLIIYNHQNVFPDYFFISVPRFNEVIHQEIDEWLYVMKHCEARDEFKSPYMKKVMERLSILKMSAQERTDYYHYLKEAIHSQDILSAAEAKGMVKGRIEGKAEGKAEGRAEGLIEGKAEGLTEGKKIGEEHGKKIALIQTAKNLHAQGVALEIIVTSTGLSLEEVNELVTTQ